MQWLSWFWAEQMVQRTLSLRCSFRAMSIHFLLRFPQSDHSGHPGSLAGAAQRLYLLLSAINFPTSSLRGAMSHAPHVNKLFLECDGHRCVLPPGDTFVCFVRSERADPVPDITGEEEDLHQLSSCPDLQLEHDRGLLTHGLQPSPGLLCCWSSSALHKSFKSSQRQCEENPLTLWSDTFLRPQFHWSFNARSWESPWVLYGLLFGHFCEVWTFLKGKGLRVECPMS